MKRAEFQDWITGQGGRYAPIEPPHPWEDTRTDPPTRRLMVAAGEVGPITHVLLADGAVIQINTGHDHSVMNLHPWPRRLAALIAVELPDAEDPAMARIIAMAHRSQLSRAFEIKAPGGPARLT